MWKRVGRAVIRLRKENPTITAANAKREESSQDVIENDTVSVASSSVEVIHHQDSNTMGDAGEDHPATVQVRYNLFSVA